MKKLIRRLLVICIVLVICVAVYLKRDDIIAFFEDKSDANIEETVSEAVEDAQEAVLTETQEVIDGVFTEEVKADLWDSVKSFFSTLWNAVVDFVKGKAEENGS